jgi:hypothetical protein
MHDAPRIAFVGVTAFNIEAGTRRARRPYAFDMGEFGI